MAIKIEITSDGILIKVPRGAGKSSKKTRRVEVKDKLKPIPEAYMHQQCTDPKTGLNKFNENWRFTQWKKGRELGLSGIEIERYIEANVDLTKENVND